MIGVLHAYSRANAGDGLLVDLTIRRLTRAGVRPEDVVIVALDPTSFSGRVVGIGTPGRSLDGRLLRGVVSSATLTASAFARRPVGRVGQALSSCGGFVAVGGGYLRTPDLQSSMGTLVNHLPQLVFAARSKRPSMYLPQSIGPLPGPVGSLVRQSLKGIDTVCLRDDESADELESQVAVKRVPDLAVLEIAERGDPQRRQDVGGLVVVGRALKAPAAWGARLRSLAEHSDLPVRWALQAGGDSAKSDDAFYQSIGVRSVGLLADVLARSSPVAVVSVRLHGALMAVMAGVPAIHLSYDRKGPAAFEDLGLSQFCIDATHVEPRVLSDLIDEIRHDPGSYWRAIAAARPHLVAASGQLDRELKRFVQHAISSSG